MIHYDHNHDNDNNRQSAVGTRHSPGLARRRGGEPGGHGEGASQPLSGNQNQPLSGNMNGYIVVGHSSLKNSGEHKKMG